MTRSVWSDDAIMAICRVVFRAGMTTSTPLAEAVGKVPIRA